jgi:hypothetical protein
MNKFEMVCQTCGAVTKDITIYPSVFYDVCIKVKCDQCGEEEDYYDGNGLEKVELDIY